MSNVISVVTAPASVGSGTSLPVGVASIQTTIGTIKAGFSELSRLAVPPASESSQASFAALIDTFSGSTGSTSSVASTTFSQPLSPTGNEVVAEAERYLGVRYTWGGTSRATGFDCSGLVQHVYQNLGIALPRTSEQQATIGTPVSSLAAAQPGDLVFFEPGPGGPGHVGIYIGNGEMIDAPYTGTVVQIQAVGTPCEIRRVLPTTTAAQTAGSYGTPSALVTSGGSSTPSTSGLGSIPANLAPLFLSASSQSGVPPQLLAAVARAESGYNPNAVSSAGAEGIMQLMPGTAAGLGVDPFNPAQAINAAAQLLASYIHQFGSIPLALAAYNAGPGAVQRYGGIPPYTQTQNYVQTVMGYAGYQQGTSA